MATGELLRCTGGVRVMQNQEEHPWSLLSPLLCIPSLLPARFGLLGLLSFAVEWHYPKSKIAGLLRLAVLACIRSQSGNHDSTSQKERVVGANVPSDETTGTPSCHLYAGVP